MAAMFMLTRTSDALFPPFIGLQGEMTLHTANHNEVLVDPPISSGGANINGPRVPYARLKSMVT